MHVWVHVALNKFHIKLVIAIIVMLFSSLSNLSIIKNLPNSSEGPLLLKNENLFLAQILKKASKSIFCFISCINNDSAVIFCHVSPLYVHPIVCDWAKIVSKISQKFDAFYHTHWSKLVCAIAAKCGWAPNPVLPCCSIDQASNSLITKGLVN